MKKHIISVSKQDLTRCSSCSRHHQIDRGLDQQALLALKCDFCGGQLIGAAAPSPLVQSRTSRLAMGLLGASLAFGACQEDETVENSGGAMMMPAGESAGETAGETAGDTAGVDMLIAGDSIGEAMYGAIPAGEFAGEEAAGETAGVEMIIAGEPMQEALYGAFPAGEFAGEEAGVEMMMAGEEIPQEPYGSFPAGAEAGTEAGAEAGAEAGTEAGEEMMSAGEEG